MLAATPVAPAPVRMVGGLRKRSAASYVRQLRADARREAALPGTASAPPPRVLVPPPPASLSLIQQPQDCAGPAQLPGEVDHKAAQTRSPPGAKK